MNILKPLAALAMLVTLSGCSIKQTVTPASFVQPAQAEICMVPEQGLRKGFHQTYRDQLLKKGFAVRELPAGSSATDCALVTRYTGTWAWDLALYMNYADIKVFQASRQIGHANYDARWGGGRLDKFIDAETKIIEMTNQLFPLGAAALPQATPSLESPAAGQPLSKAQYQQEQLQRLMNENLSYEEYKRRHQQIMQQ